MIGRLKICVFAHSWISDWNHGNAHFLRGLAYELDRLGHDVRCYEEVDSWSMTNLLEEGIDRATEAFRNFRKAFPTLIYDSIGIMQAWFLFFKSSFPKATLPL